jgi:hypothetical protein
MFLPNGDSFTGEWRRGLIGGMSVLWGLCFCWLRSAVRYLWGTNLLRLISV